MAPRQRKIIAMILKYISLLVMWIVAFTIAMVSINIGGVKPYHYLTVPLVCIYIIINSLSATKLIIIKIKDKSQ
jgi:hypothetical protein